MARFWWGLTRPKTAWVSSTRGSLVVGQVAGVHRPVGVGQPGLPATAATVSGLSPEITFIVTPWAAK